MIATPSIKRLGAGLEIGRLTGAYLVLGALKHVLPLSVIARGIWRAPQSRRDPIAERRLLACVAQARRWSRAKDDDCLQRSLLLYRELSRAGADPTLVAGFRQAAGRLRGHAWVVVDGGAVAELAEDVTTFVPVVAFGRGGAVVAAA